MYGKVAGNGRISAAVSLMGWLLITGCSALPQPEILPPPDGPPAGYRDPSGPGDFYRVETAHLIAYTYRAGWLAGLTHNHVLETDEIHGFIQPAEDPEASRAVLYFRPWDLTLDRFESRAAAGPGFESARSAGDIAETRARMLGPRGFHSNEFPFVVATIRGKDESTITVSLHFRNTTFETVVPVTWQQTDDRLEVKADIQLTHADLGIRPYSAFAGALAVAEPIRVRLQLSALRTRRPSTISTRTIPDIAEQHRSRHAHTGRYPR